MKIALQFSPGCLFLHCQSFKTIYCCSVIQSRKYTHYNKSPSQNEENIKYQLLVKITTDPTLPSSTYQGREFKGLDFFPLHFRSIGKYCVKCIKSCFHETKTEVQVEYLGGSFRVLCSGRQAEKATRSPRSVTLCKHFGSRLQTTGDDVILVCCLIALALLASQSLCIFSFSLSRYCL